MELDRKSFGSCSGSESKFLGTVLSEGWDFMEFFVPFLQAAGGGGAAAWKGSAGKQKEVRLEKCGIKRMGKCGIERMENWD